MSITEFIQQAHPATLDFIENNLMKKLLEVDKWTRVNEKVRESKRDN
jgi:hypothetical protein